MATRLITPFCLASMLFASLLADGALSELLQPPAGAAKPAEAGPAADRAAPVPLRAAKAG